MEELPQAQAEAPALGLTATVSPRLDYDFSKIPIHAPTPGVIQMKLAINQLGDEYEEEADRVSQQVIRTLEPQTPASPCCGGSYPTSQTVHRDSDSASVPTKRIPIHETKHRSAPPSVHETLAASGQPLDQAACSFMEPRFRCDFSGVRVHTGANAEQSARDVNAYAYTVGHHIVFGQGRYTPETHEGKRLLAHELTHVVQQTGGSVVLSSVLQRQPKPSPAQSEVSHASLDELKRVGDAWEVTLEGYTEADAVGGYIWPHGLPPGVRIDLLAVVEEPVKIGRFRITGVTYESLDTMDASFAKWFFDLGLRAADRPGHPLHTIRLWFKAFIPQELLRLPGYDCFKGDNRSYSPDRSASARMTSEVLLTNLNTTAPTMTQTHWCGLTRQVDCDTETVIHSATANTSGMKFYNFRYPGAVVWDWDQPYPPAAHPPEITVGQSDPVSVDYIGAAADPLVSVAPFVDIWAHIALDLLTGVLTVQGKADDYPAFEGYVIVNEKYGPFNLFTLDGDDWVISLIGGANRVFDSRLSVGSYVATG